MSPTPLPSRLMVRVTAASVIIASCLAVMLVHSHRVARHAASQMSAVFTAEAPVIRQAGQHERQRARVLSTVLAKISQTKRAAKTPAQISARLASALPPLPHPVVVALPPSSHDAPAPPALITVPQDDLKPLFDRLQDCRACQEQLHAAQQDVRDQRAQLAALTAERNAAINAARGGGFWSRFRSNVKWFAIGGALGALAASAAR
jgi:hypothetical protein